MDGLYAVDLMGVRQLVGPATYRHAAGMFRASEDSMTAEGWLMSRTGGVRTSRRVADPTGNVQQAIVRRANPAGDRVAVMPTWQGLELIRDVYSGAPKGRGRGDRHHADRGRGAAPLRLLRAGLLPAGVGMPIVPIVGPAGAGKSQVIESERRPGDVLIDFTALFVALSGAVRGPDGAYPERQDDDPVVPLTNAVQGMALYEATRRGLRGYVTSSRRRDVGRLETITGQAARIIDPGEDVIAGRLAVPIEVDLASFFEDPEGLNDSDLDGVISEECAKAAARWYDHLDRLGVSNPWQTPGGKRYAVRRRRRGRRR